MRESLIRTLTEQAIEDIARETWDETLEEHPVEDTPGTVYPYWLDTFTNILHDRIVDGDPPALDVFCDCTKEITLEDVLNKRCSVCSAHVLVLVYKE